MNRFLLQRTNKVLSFHGFFCASFWILLFPSFVGLERNMQAIRHGTEKNQERRIEPAILTCVYMEL